MLERGSGTGLCTTRQLGRMKTALPAGGTSNSWPATEEGLRAKMNRLKSQLDLAILHPNWEVRHPLCPRTLQNYHPHKVLVAMSMVLGNGGLLTLTKWTMPFENWKE